MLQVSASFFGADEIVLVVTDITHITNLEQLRKEFVGNVSHELRTPLTVMRGYLETLQDMPGNSPDGRQSLHPDVRSSGENGSFG